MCGEHMAKPAVNTWYLALSQVLFLALVHYLQQVLPFINITYFLFRILVTCLLTMLLFCHIVVFDMLC